jgi:sugar phosphate isomerase/epimerase
MKIACSTFMAPGETIREKLSNLERLGFEGVEVRLLLPEATPEVVAEYEEALAESPLGIGAVIAPGPAYALLFDSEESKNVKLEGARRALEIGARLGAGSFITPEYSPQLPLPLWYPAKRLSPREEELFYSFMADVAEYAEKLSTTALLEPINRYETHFYYSIPDVIAVCDRVGSPRVRLVIDFFHMNIEEADIPKSIESAAGYVRHVQLGDNNRELPGKGHTDFRAGFAALRKIGYDGYMALECRLPADPERELAECVRYLRQCLQDSLSL